MVPVGIAAINNGPLSPPLSAVSLSVLLKKWKKKKAKK